MAEEVPPGARVIDVGTDHARLPVWLALTGRARHVWGVDVREGPLQNARRLVEETGTRAVVELRLADGLAGLGPADGDTVVAAGLGGETILSVLSGAPWLRGGATLILAPQSKQDLLRRWLRENGFRVQKERLVRDAGKLYPILIARGGDPQPFTEAEYHTGLWALIFRDPLLEPYLAGLIRRAASAAPYNENARLLLRELRAMEEDRKHMPTVSDLCALLAQKAPPEKRLSFDNVGLLVGHPDAPVRRVLAALDITDEVIAEAADLGADLIVSHHPLFFELKTVTDETWTGARVLTLAENRIAAICMHTNLDAARGGVNDALLAAVGCEYTGELDPETQIGRVGLRPRPVPLGEFLEEIKHSLSCAGLRYHDAGRPVHRVAVCGGSGGGELALAHAAGCDTYVTADIKYDPFLEAKHLGINLIDADHFCTENVVVPVLRDWLLSAFPDVDVLLSRSHTQTAKFFI